MFPLALLAPASVAGLALIEGRQAVAKQNSTNSKPANQVANPQSQINNIDKSRSPQLKALHAAI